MIPKPLCYLCNSTSNATTQNEQRICFVCAIRQNEKVQPDNGDLTPMPMEEIKIRMDSFIQGVLFSQLMSNLSTTIDIVSAMATLFQMYMLHICNVYVTSEMLEEAAEELNKVQKFHDPGTFSA